MSEKKTCTNCFYFSKRAVAVPSRRGDPFCIWHFSFLTGHFDTNHCDCWVEKPTQEQKEDKK